MRRAFNTCEILRSVGEENIPDVAVKREGQTADMPTIADPLLMKVLRFIVATSYNASAEPERHHPLKKRVVPRKGAPHEQRTASEHR